MLRVPDPEGALSDAEGRYSLVPVYEPVVGDRTLEEKWWDVLNRDIGAVIPPRLLRYANFQPLGRIGDRRAEGRAKRLHMLPDGPGRFPGRELDRR